MKQVRTEIPENLAAAYHFAAVSLGITVNEAYRLGLSMSLFNHSVHSFTLKMADHTNLLEADDASHSEAP